MPRPNPSRRAVLLSGTTMAVCAACDSGPDGYYDGTRPLTSTSRSRPAAPLKDVWDGFSLGVTRPVASNTGHDRRRIDGTITSDRGISEAGLVIENKRIEGFVRVDAADVVLRNCEIVGRRLAPEDLTSVAGLIQTGQRCSNLLIDRCTLVPAHPSYVLNAVRGTEFTAQRCHIANVVDGFHTNGGQFAVEACYLHDFSFFDGSTGSDHESDARFPGWCHTDGFEIFSCDAARIVGCNIQSYISARVGTPQSARDGNPRGRNAGRCFPRLNYTNGITVAPGHGHVRDLVIDRNWLEGGEVGIQMPRQNDGFDEDNSVAVTGNRFGLDLKAGYVGNPVGPKQYMRIGITGTVAVRGNVFDRVGSVPVALRGKPIPAPVRESTGLGWEFG